MNTSARSLSVAFGLALGVVSVGCNSRSAATSPAQATAATATQDPPGDPPGDAPEAEQHLRHHYGGVTKLIVMSLADLDLSPAQRATVTKIGADLRDKMAPARVAGRELANVLADGIDAGRVDRAKADGTIADLRAAVAGLHEVTTGSLNQLHEALSPEQRRALADKVLEHWEKWKVAHAPADESQAPATPGARRIASLATELDLSQDQIDRITTNFSAVMAGVDQSKDDEVEAHLEVFATAFAADDFDAKTLDTENVASVQMSGRGATRMARFYEAVAPVLTVEQRGQLAGHIRDDASRPEP